MGFILSEADTKSNPMKVVAAVQQMMYNWESRDLWNQMSPDYFFSAVLLRSLSSSSQLTPGDPKISARAQYIDCTNLI
jgi:hypothetical protein